MIVFERKKLAKTIDQSLLHPNTTEEKVRRFCQECIKYEFYAAIVCGNHLPLAAECLSESEVRVGSAVGFPSGAHLPEVKAFEAAELVRRGAQEVDTVLNIGALVSGRVDAVEQELARIVEAVKEVNQSTVTKVVLETGYLTDSQKKVACEIALKAGVDFVKTCTGFGPGIATTGDIRLMRQVVGSQIGVKASGGLTSYDRVIEMIDAGASRIGTQLGVEILAGCPS